LTETKTTKRVFAREATRLVRNISPLDAFLASFGFVAIPLALVTYTTAPFLFPGSDMVAATILTTILSVPIALMFSLFAWAMPRSGGDYVLTSRVLHPIVGFVASFNLMFWFIFFAGFETNWVTTAAIWPSLTVIGTVTSNQSLINLANLIVVPQNITIVGLVVIALFTVVLLKGVRATFIVADILFLISLVGLGLALILLATSTNSTFVDGFSKFASYGNVTASAHRLGYSSQGANPLLSTLGIMPFIYLTTGFAFVTTYYGGEVRSVKKSMFYSQVLVAAISGGLLTLVAVFSVRDFGYDFLGSISYLQGTSSPQYPFGGIFPFFNLFLSMLSDNPLVLWLLALTYVAALAAAFLPSLMAVSRSVFAWSFDRIIPAKFSYVSERLHVPVITILVMSAV
jgi:amino acid transporter